MKIDDIKGIRRTYELFDIEWEDGAKWTGFEDEANARDTVGRAFTRGRIGRVTRRTWTVDIPIDKLGLYRPGCGDEALLDAFPCGVCEEEFLTEEARQAHSVQAGHDQESDR